MDIDVNKLLISAKFIHMIETPTEHDQALALMDDLVEDYENNLH